MSKDTLLHILRNELDDAPSPLQTKNLNIMSIEQSNIIIALFECGGKTSNYFNKEIGYIGAGPNEGMPPTTKNLKYHISPEWLNPVIDRIECGDYTVTISKEGCVIKSDDYDFYPNADGAFYEEREGEDRQSATFTAIVYFLKWANENNITI